MLRSSRHYLWAQSQWHHTICRWRKRKKKRKKGPVSIRPTWKQFQNQHIWETGWSTYGLSRAPGSHLELNWTNLQHSTKHHRCSLRGKFFVLPVNNTPSKRCPYVFFPVSSTYVHLRFELDVWTRLLSSVHGFSAGQTSRTVWFEAREHAFEL